jgi:hypothetical protein
MMLVFEQLKSLMSYEKRIMIKHFMELYTFINICTLLPH